MRKLILAVALMTSVSAHASGKGITQICSDYADYLGHAYDFAVSDQEADRQVLLRDISDLKLSMDTAEWEVVRLRHDAKRRYMTGISASVTTPATATNITSLCVSASRLRPQPFPAGQL